MPPFYASGLRRAGGYDSHGLMECLSLDFHKEVNGVTGQFAFVPDPERLFDDEAGRSTGLRAGGMRAGGIGQYLKITVLDGQESIAAADEQGREFSLSGSAYNRFGPDHGCFSSGVG